VQSTPSVVAASDLLLWEDMSRIQIENGYALCVLHRQTFTHLLLEQTLADGSIVLHGEKKLTQEDFLAFFKVIGSDFEGIKANFASQPVALAKNEA
jgi:hypothetical protein